MEAITIYCNQLDQGCHKIKFVLNVNFKIKNQKKKNKQKIKKKQKRMVILK